jgi:hypothetical protein
MKKLVIDRSRWLRGETEGVLLNDDGRMCCLGFEALRIGLTAREIRYGGNITTLECWCGREEKQHLMREVDYPGWLGDFFTSRTDVGYAQHSNRTDLPQPYPMGSAEDALTIINDCPDVDDATREAWLTEGFRALGGIEVEFVDGPVQS